jgi:hypothetical protein
MGTKIITLETSLNTGLFFRRVPCLRYEILSKMLQTKL